MPPVLLYCTIFVLFCLLVTTIILGIISIQKRIPLEREVQQLRIKDNLNKEVFAVITHDLKEPLINFQLLSQQLRNQTGPVQEQFLDALETEIKQTHITLKSLSDWAIYELSCHKSPQPPTVLVNSQVSLGIQEVRALADAKNITIKNAVDRPTRWEINRCVFRITLRNLLTNAIQFSPKGTIIEVCFGKNGLEVRDQGIGLSKEVQDSLFKSRISPNYGTNRENGWGIGLLITRNLLSKSGYIITAKNLEGAGACFTVQKAVA